jgi:hypothetical protein
LKGLEFYSTAAQVIPLLSLLLLVEVRTSTAGLRIYEGRAIPALLLIQWADELYLLAILKSESDPGSIGFLFTILVIGLTSVLLAVWLAIYVVSARVLSAETEKTPRG